MTDALKPCPFCGGSARLGLDDFINGRIIEHPDYFIECDAPVAGGACQVFVRMHDQNHDLLVAAWNRRADLPVRVLPLVWMPDGGTHQSANSLGLHYGLAQANDGNWVVDLGHSLPLFPDIDLAKAAAQADHESRIRAALEE